MRQPRFFIVALLSLFVRFIKVIGESAERSAAEFIDVSLMPAFLESAADDVVDGVDRYEGAFIDVEDGFLEFVDFEARDDGVENLFLFARVAACAVEEGDAASQSLGESDIDLVWFVRDDHDGVGFVESLDDDVDHLGDDKVGDERVHRLVPAKEEAGARQDEEVDEHDDFADGEYGFLVEDDGDDLCAVERAARANDESDAKADDDAAEDGGEKEILRDSREWREVGRPKREQEDGSHGGDGEGFADLLVADVEEREVEEDEKDAQRLFCDGMSHDGEADDAAVDDVVRDEEDFKTDGRDDGTDEDHHIFLREGEQALLATFLFFFHKEDPFVQPDASSRKRIHSMMLSLYGKNRTRANFI